LIKLPDAHRDAQEMEYLQSIGADAIMTDVPDIGAEVLKQP